MLPLCDVWTGCFLKVSLAADNIVVFFYLAVKYNKLSIIYIFKYYSFAVKTFSNGISGPNKIILDKNLYNRNYMEIILKTMEQS